MCGLFVLHPMGRAQRALTRAGWFNENSRPLCESMKILSERIQRELETETNRIEHCAIYEDELQRI
jgi:hypothetical protein